MNQILQITHLDNICELNLQSFLNPERGLSQFSVGANDDCDVKVSFAIPKMTFFLKNTHLHCEVAGRAFLLQTETKICVNPSYHTCISLFQSLTAPQPTTNTVLQQSTISFGRLSDNDFTLTSSMVSRHHAELKRLDDQWILVDKGSSNGTFVNHKKIQKQYLFDGDVFSIAPYYFRFYRQKILSIGVDDPYFTQNLQANTADSVQKDTQGKETPLSGCRVVLLSGKRMYTLDLPSQIEGEFHFPCTISEDYLLLSNLVFAAEEDKWIASCNAGYFINFNKKVDPFSTCSLDNSMTLNPNRITLSDGDIWTIPVGKNEYTLLIEYASQQRSSFQKFAVANNCCLSIGRLSNNDICFDNHVMSKKHGELQHMSGRWEFRDTNSTNGVYLSGKRILSGKLNLWDELYFLGMRVIVGNGFIAVNSKHENVKIDVCTGKLSSSLDRLSACALPQHSQNGEEEEYFTPMPRRRLAMEYPDITFEAPPVSMAHSHIPLALRYGGALLSGNVLSMASSVLFPVLSQRYTEKERREYEEHRKAMYARYLIDKRKAIHEEVRREEEVLNTNYPALDKVLSYALTGKHLWERRTVDDDFLKLRVGVGTYPVQAKYDCPHQRFDMDDDPLEVQMYELASQKAMLKNVPILTSFCDEFVCGVLGEAAQCYEFVHRLLLQLINLYSYDEVKIVFLANPKQCSKFEYLKYIPHLWNDQRTFRFFASNVMEACEISEYIKKMLESEDDKETALQKILKNRPYYFIVALDKKLFDCLEALKEVMSLEENSGFSIVTVFDHLPKECSQIIQLSNHMGDIIHLHSVGLDDERFMIDSLDEQKAQKSVKALWSTKTRSVTEKYNLPSMITFLEMFHVGKVEQLNPLKRWDENNPVKSLSAPVGVNTDGTLFELDLHEKRHGPHGLVAGMTGSGKSEFIITYILSMAVNYSPDEVAFVLIDYKGGGLAGAFVDEERGIYLPHVVGTITNLDGAAIQRSLASIQSELLRRQTIFNEAKKISNEGTMDIYTYQKLRRKGVVKEALPHLFIISDEFAELKAQEPDFMDKLISAARIGRSLGVHLILATQKPSGVVDDQIWSNTKFRVCLRVQDRSDSMDMLKRPEAAELSDTGRFYLQVGYNEYFAMGQSAWCGADYFPQEQAVVTQGNSVSFINNIGEVLLESRLKSNATDSGMKQIVAIVNYLSNLAKRCNIKPRQLWMKPLEDVITLQQLKNQYKIDYTSTIQALVGLADDPQKQQQYPCTMDFLNCKNYLVMGDSGTGKTTLIQTILYELVSHYTPDKLQFYIMDFSSHTLNAFKNTPHCGMVLEEDDESALLRFFTMLREMIAKRKAIFKDDNVSNYLSYIQKKAMPLILVVIDNIALLSNINSLSDEYYVLGDYLKDGDIVGIKFIITGDHPNDFSSMVRRNAIHRITLQMKDRFDYTEALSVRCSFAPPVKNGRGICVYDERPLEYQVAVCTNTADEQERIHAVQELVSSAKEKYAEYGQAVHLPVIQEQEEYCDFCADIPLERIPIGYSYETANKVSIPLQQLYLLSVYFGNPDGVVPILKNILFSADRENMKIVVVKRLKDSVFQSVDEFQEIAPLLEVIECEPEALLKLFYRLADEIVFQKQLRNEYCSEHGVAFDANKDDSIMRLVAPYIRQNSIATLVLFESFADFCKVSDDAVLSTYPVLFTQGRWYNYYMIACTYPEDMSRLSSEKLFLDFTHKGDDKMSLIFGGQFHQQCVMDSLPTEYRSKVAKSMYNRGIMEYHETVHPFIMPCGAIEDVRIEQDELPIF